MNDYHDYSKEQYKDGFYYHRSTNSTYIMKDGTCMAVYRGYVPDKCSHGYYKYPEIIDTCPV